MRRSNVHGPEALVPTAVRYLMTVTMAVILLSACGGSSDETNDAANGVTTTASEVTTAANDGPAESAAADGIGSGNAAIVTIGTTTYEVPADPLNLCNNLGNLIFGSYASDATGAATQAGGTDVSIQVNFAVPVTDWEGQDLQPPSINVDVIDEGVRWTASTEQGLGAVEPWELQDGMATGEASFVGKTVGSGEEVGAETGTFEVVCN